MDCGFTIRIEAAIPTSSSTNGVFMVAIRMFLDRCPSTAGLALSRTIPDVWKHTPDHIDCVLWTFKALGQFLCDTPGILDFDIPPAVDVDLLNPCPKHVLGEEGKLRHLSINGIHQFLTVHTLYCNPVVLHILGDIALNLILHIPRFPGQ